MVILIHDVIRNSQLMISPTLNSVTGKWIMVSVILASAMAFIDGTALNVALPSLQKDLNATGIDLFWILNSYLLMLAALILTGGSLGDKLGRKKIFMIGIAIFILGSALCSFSPTVSYLIASRALQGLGGALMIPGSLSIITASFEEERGKAIGTWSAVTTLVTIGGPILGGTLADAGLWRLIFFINIPIGIASLIILRFKVPESRDEQSDHSIDYLGSIAIVIGLALLTYGFLKIPNVGFNNAQVYISIGTGIIALILFVQIQKTSKHPMVPLHLFKNRTFTGANLLTFFLYSGLFVGMLFLTLNMVQIQRYSQLQAGLSLLPFTALIVMLSRWSGSLADKFGSRQFLIGGPLLVAAGLLLLSFVKHTHGPSDFWLTYFPGIFIFGLGMSITDTPLTSTVMGALPNHYSGTASGINNAVTRISNVFSNAVVGALAVLFFTVFLTSVVEQVSLKEYVRTEIIQQSVNLRDAKVPANVTGENNKEVEHLYREGFIKTYSLVMRISAIFAFVGALMALVFIRDRKDLS
jgi:EmrB/QacA subfamily drug resistance transporter